MGGAVSGAGQTVTVDEMLDFHLTTREAFGDLDDDKYWAKCGPQHRKSQTAGSDANAAPSAHFSASRSRENSGACVDDRYFSVCPGPNSPATFKFTRTSGDASGALLLLSVSFHLSTRPDFPNAPYMPTHLFGELSKTSNGANYLVQRGTLQRALDGLLRFDQPALLSRATLWTLAHISSSEFGLNAVLKLGASMRDHEGRLTNAIKLISDIAVASNNLSLRGTAVTALSLVSKTERGRRLLRDNGWQTEQNGNQVHGNVVVPRSFSMAYRPLETAKTRRVWDGLDLCFNQPETDPLPIPGLDEEALAAVFGAVSRMINQITMKEAHGTLVRLKAKHPDLFASPLVLLRVHEFLDNFSFEPWVRQFLFKLFHVHVPFDQLATWAKFDQIDM